MLALTIAAGELHTLRKWATVLDEEKSRFSGNSVLLDLLLKPACVDFLQREKRIGEIVALVSNEVDPNRQWRTINQLANNEKAIEAIACGGELQDILDLIKRSKSKGPGLEQFIFGQRTFPHWAGHGDREVLSSLFKEMSKEQRKFDLATLRLVSQPIEYPNRQSLEVLIEMISFCGDSMKRQLDPQLVTNPLQRWKIIDSGWERELLKVAKLTQFEQRFNEDILFSTTGVVANHVSKSNFDAAEKLLFEYANHEKGYARLSAFWIRRGVLKERIAVLRSTEPNSSRLAFMLKCAGEYDEAADVAIRNGDLRQAIRCLGHGRRWDRAAELQRELIAIASVMPSKEADTHASDQAQLATFQHLAGREEECTKTCDELMEIAGASPNSPIDALCFNVLLLTDRIEPAIELAKRFDSSLYLTLLGQRGEHGKAFESVGFTMDDPTAWVDRLMAKHPDLRQRYAPCMEAIQVCDLLDENARRERADVIYKRLDKLFPINAKISPSGSYSFRPTREGSELDKALFQSDRMDLLSPRLLRRMLTLTYPSAYTHLAGASSSPINEAYGWWEHLNPEIFLPSRFTSGPPPNPNDVSLSEEIRIQRLQTLHDIMSDDDTITLDGETMSKLDYIDLQLQQHNEWNHSQRRMISMIAALLRFGEKERASKMLDRFLGQRVGFRNIYVNQLGVLLYAVERYSDAFGPLGEFSDANPQSLE